MIGWFKKDPPRTFLVKRFAPEKDITAYEAAYLLSRMMYLGPSKQVNITPEQWEELDPQFRRHFRDHEEFTHE